MVVEKRPAQTTSSMSTGPSKSSPDPETVYSKPETPKGATHLKTGNNVIHGVKRGPQTGSSSQEKRSRVKVEEEEEDDGGYDDDSVEEAETPSKKVNCEYCGKSMRKDTIKRHVRSIHGNSDMVYRCPHHNLGCKYTSTRKDQVNTHVKSCEERIRKKMG